MTPVLDKEKTQAEGAKITFKAPDIEHIERKTPLEFENLRTPQQHFVYFGDAYHKILELIKEKELKINRLKHEMDYFEDKSSNFIIKICLIFTIFLFLTALWSFLLGR